jgi:hypothetical protein
LAWLVALPGLYHIADFAYDGIIAPMLAAWARRQAPATH